MKKIRLLLCILCVAAVSLCAAACSDNSQSSPADEPSAESAYPQPQTAQENPTTPVDETPTSSKQTDATQAQQTQTAPFVWQTDDPQNHDMDPAVLADLDAALPNSSIYSMVVVKDGVIVDEYYQDGYDQNSLYRLNSATKSFTSALIGIAIDQGYIGSVEDPLSDYLPQVLAQSDTRKQQITLKHLLTHTSGLEWYEWGNGYTNWSEFQSAPNWVDYILGRTLIYTPGTQFAYSTGNTHLLTAALEAATGMSAQEYARINLFEPLGITNFQWDTDPQGITDGGNGLHLSTRDAARFGLLFLQNGQWQGEQIVPAEWVATSTTIQNGGAGDGTGSYCYQWWRRVYHAGGYDTYTPPLRRTRLRRLLCAGPRRTIFVCRPGDRPCLRHHRQYRHLFSPPLFYRLCAVGLSGITHWISPPGHGGASPSLFCPHPADFCLAR